MFEKQKKIPQYIHTPRIGYCRKIEWNNPFYLGFQKKKAFYGLYQNKKILFFTKLIFFYSTKYVTSVHKIWGIHAEYVYVHL
jgi:hypothetical protein